MPIPTVDDVTAAEFSHRVTRILHFRNEGHRLTLEAEARLEKALGPLRVNDWGDEGFTIKASKAFLGGRRRFDASVHNPGVAAIRRHLTKHGEGFSSVAETGYDVWLPARFRRVPAEDGVLLVESAALVEVNPDIDKRIAEVDFGDPYRGRVLPGWLLVARSGQVYGINGTAVLATEALANHVISDDVIRVAPNPDCRVRAGYLLVALSHPLFGRPLVKSLAYGSSIPHIDPTDLVEHKVVRLKPAEEFAIADLAEASAKARAAADVIEREIAREAGIIIERFIS